MSKTMKFKITLCGNNEYEVESIDNKKNTINFSCLPIIITILVFAIIMGILVFIAINQCKAAVLGEKKDLCKTVIATIIQIVFSIYIVALPVPAISKALKTFAKMEFLKEIMNAKIDYNERIKKYCDTLVEL